MVEQQTFALQFQTNLYFLTDNVPYLRYDQTNAVIVKQGTVATFSIANAYGNLEGLQVYSNFSSTVGAYERINVWDVDTSWNGPQIYEILVAGTTQIVAQDALMYSVGVSGNGTRTLVWNTANVLTGLYYIGFRSSTRAGFLLVFVASISPVAVGFWPRIFNSPSTSFACSGDTLVFRRPTGNSRFSTTPYKDLYVSCIPLNSQGETHTVTILANGPSPLVWTVAGINPDEQQCHVTYGPPVSDVWSSDIVSWLRVVPRPTVSMEVVHPCESCLTGTYSSSLGASAPSACASCLSGNYATQQGASICTSCPSNSGTGTSVGSTERGQCVCDPGYAGNLTNLTQTCAACPANSYCAGLSQRVCPANTRSPPLSSQVIQCRCVAGYRCTYTDRRNTTLTITFNMAQSSFISQDPSIRNTLAAVAAVPVSHVSLVINRTVLL